jgi:hypothetical protein
MKKHVDLVANHWNSEYDNHEQLMILPNCGDAMRKSTPSSIARRRCVSANIVQYDDVPFISLVVATHTSLPRMCTGVRFDHESKSRMSALNVFITRLQDWVYEQPLTDT